MDLGLLLSFLGASILLSLMPGPDNIFVLTESLTKGYRNGVAISLGLCVGVLLHTLAAATGLSIIIQQSAIAFSVVKYLGAAYLIYLAYLATRELRQDLDLTSNVSNEDFRIIPLIKKGFMMNVLNPKVSLFFIAFLPQFIKVDGLNITLQMIFLGLIFMLQALVVFSFIAILSSRLTKQLNSERFWKYTKVGKVLVLSVLGLALAFARK